MKHLDKKTIEIKKEDYDYLDMIRTTDKGKVSFNDIVSVVCNVHKKYLNEKEVPLLPSTSGSVKNDNVE